MPIFKRHFTLAEANALLPRLRRNFALLHELDEQVRRLHDKHRDVLERRVVFNVGGPGLNEFFYASVQARAVLERIISLGVQVKDVDRGLCDFPYLNPETGEEVFLCWQLGEDEISAWHPLDEGYAGRRDLGEWT